MASTKKLVRPRPKRTRVEPIEESSPAQQGELFRTDLASWSLKDDHASMEVPLFSLAKIKDTQVRKFSRGPRFVTVIPSAVGAATVFDKDLLLFIASQIVEQQNRNKAAGIDKPVGRTVHVESCDFLLGTGRGDGGDSYARLLDMLRRLRGTTIETNIPTGGKVQTDGFSMIDDYSILSEKKSIVRRKNRRTGEVEEQEVSRVISFKVTISDWMYAGLEKFEVLTLDRRYFELSSPIERRLYELARKHCGDENAVFKMNIDLLAEKIGVKGARFRFRDDLRETIAADRLPEYHIALDPKVKPDMVVFYTRDNARLHLELSRTSNVTWYAGLERHDNVAAWRSVKAPAKKRATGQVEMDTE